MIDSLLTCASFLHMEQLFIPYSKTCDFWEDEDNYRHPSRDFWDWAEVMLGDRVPLGLEPTAEKPWGLVPHNDWVADKQHPESGYYDNGRLITFYDPTLAMMFKLRWF